MIGRGPCGRASHGTVSDNAAASAASSAAPATPEDGIGGGARDGAEQHGCLAGRTIGPHAERQQPVAAVLGRDRGMDQQVTASLASTAGSPIAIVRTGTGAPFAAIRLDVAAQFLGQGDVVDTGPAGDIA